MNQNVRNFNVVLVNELQALSEEDLVVVVPADHVVHQVSLATTVLLKVIENTTEEQEIGRKKELMDDHSRDKSLVENVKIKRKKTS